MKVAKIRLFVEENLKEGQGITLSREAAHYLFNVMRLGLGDGVRLFNGRDGEWRAEVVDVGKKGGVLACAENLRPQRRAPDLWLMFAPVKKAKMDIIVEKSVELGVGRLCPVLTAHTNAERIRPERIEAQIREAAEQSERLDLPELAPLAKLEPVLANWPEERHLFFADERAAPGNALSALSSQSGPAAILIGPEGGFSEEESNRLRSHPATTTLSLGPRILRAETAAIAALTLWQAVQGDWQNSLP